MPEASAARTKSSLRQRFQPHVPPEGPVLRCAQASMSFLLWRQVSSLAPVFSEFLQ